MSCSQALTPEGLSSAGRGSEKLILPALQAKMKCDPEGYESELLLIQGQFNSLLNLFEQQAAMSFTSLSGVSADPSVAKDLGERAMFLSHLTPHYPIHLSQFPKQLSDLLSSSARSLPASLRYHLSQAVAFLVHRKILGVGETLALFTELQTLGDKNLKKLAFSHVVHTIRRMNQKHKDEAKNRSLQNIFFSTLQQEDELKARRALVTLCELHKRKVWFDDRTANAICTACFHSSRTMVSALSFLLDYEKITDDSDSDGSSSEDDRAQKQQILVSKQAVYKAHHMGTTASKKKKKAKLERVMRSMKRQQRMSSGDTISNHYSPLNHLKDAQGFAEKLFSRLQSCNERFEVKMMMLKVIARAIGLHNLVLINFYPFLQKYVQPHQRDVTNLLAAAVQACHHMVPPDAVEPLFKQIVNQFVHDGARPEAISVGLSSVREICLRMPSLMSEDLLQDLVLYKKSREKAVSTAARSLISLFRVLHPSLLTKKDRGRPTNPKAKPNLFGEVNVATDVPGIELLQNDNDDSGEDTKGGFASSDDEMQEVNDIGSDDIEEPEGGSFDSSDDEGIDVSGGDGDNDDADSNDDNIDEEEEEEEGEENDDDHVDADVNAGSAKRKYSDFDAQFCAAQTSLRALKKMAVERAMHASPCSTDGILSNEDFRKIKEVEAKGMAKMALAGHVLSRKGSEAFEIPSSDQLRLKRVDPAKLEINVKHRLSKEERLELVRAGREERGKYHARAAVKQKKTGGSSNRQKEHQKAMPIAAKRAKVARSRQEKTRKRLRSSKQFRGRKAWK